VLGSNLRNDCHHTFHPGSVMLRKCADMIIRSGLARHGQRNAVRFSRTEQLSLGEHAERLRRRQGEAAPMNANCMKLLLKFTRKNA